MALGRLCLATPLYPPESGGPATYAKILRDELPKQGVQVSLVMFREVRKWPKGIRHIAYAYDVWKTGHHADCILALDPVSVGLPALFAAKLLRKPFAVKVVGDYAWEQGTQRFGVEKGLDDFVQEKKQPISVRMFRFVQTLVARSATLIIVPSEYLKRIVAAWGIPEERITVIHNAVAESDGEETDNLTLTLPKPWIVTVGRLVAWKGFAEVIDAVALLRKDVPDAKLVIVGDGPLREELEARAREVLGSGYVFTGAIPRARATALMREADVFILNSSYEGLSHTLVEALQAGVPVIVSNIEANAEVVQDAGVLVMPDDPAAIAAAFKEVLSNESYKRALSEKARVRGADFSLERMVRLTQAALASIV